MRAAMTQRQRAKKGDGDVVGALAAHGRVVPEGDVAHDARQRCVVDPREDDRARQIVLADHERERLLGLEVDVDEHVLLGGGPFIRRRLRRGDLASQRVELETVPRALVTLDLLSDREGGLDATVILRKSPSVSQSRAQTMKGHRRKGEALKRRSRARVRRG